MLRQQLDLTNYQSGFTLIEVLVAIIVLAIGLLGLANLQTVSLHNDQSAYLRTQAIWLANDMADRMRSNAQYYNTNPIPNKQQHDCLTNQCTSQEIAENDLFEWNAAISTVLPGGVGTINGVTINVVTTNGTIQVTTYTVNIQWSDPVQSNVIFSMSFQI
jgi:type IV pilus assembly protein PilV